MIYLLIAVSAVAIGFMCLYFSETTKLKRKLEDKSFKLMSLEERYSSVCNERTVLSDELHDAKFERDCLRLELEGLQEKLKDISEYEDTTPEDCVRDKYCEACEFGKIYHVHSALLSRQFAMCTKGKSCPNFIQKKEND